MLYALPFAKCITVLPLPCIDRLRQQVSDALSRTAARAEAQMPAHAKLNTIPLPDGSGWVVEASWPDRPPEQLIGGFTSPESAELWIDCGSQVWRQPHLK